jgi:hypothetical protein
MRYAAATRLAVFGVALITLTSELCGAQRAATYAGLNPPDARKVIVILRDQITDMVPARGQMHARAAVLAERQGPVIAQLQKLRPHEIRSFKTINAFATTISTAEAELLAGNPQVRAVVDDVPIRLRNRGRQLPEADPAGRAQAVSSPAIQADSSSGLCNTLEPEGLQLTNAAFLDRTAPQAQTVLDGKGQPVTGKGVKVAFIADGLDTTVQGFIRPDGTNVFIDYQNFSGDPAGTPTGGDEAFGDASTIAAQDMPNGSPLLFDISQSVSAAHPLPSPCNIRIRGMAPGASLVGLDVFSSDGFTTISSFVQAIEYAVVEDDVDVISESFGSNPFYDSGNDPTSMTNEMAVRAGVTVVVASGDGGSAGTLASPGTDPWVISAGASTQFRFYAQTSFGAQPLASGYLSNNIASFSSGGFAQSSPRTVDVVAPGDTGWALCSTDTALYTECSYYQNYQNNAPPIQGFAGTSEAAPFTAGEAALIIQAYRSTHNNESPSPALVKQIVMSTATDLGAPSDEQGAGLINALAAVNAALSIHDRFGNPTARGNGLAISSTSSQVVSEPNIHESQSFAITNTGSTSRHLEPVLQVLGAPIGGASVNLEMTPAIDPVFTNSGGAIRAYQTQTFTVGAGAQHLDAAIAYQTSAPGSSSLVVWISLLDPSGRQVAYSTPAGTGNGYGHVDVVMPAPGLWTAVIVTHPSGDPASYTGPVQFTWSTEKFASFGSVSPAALDLAPGATGIVSADFTMPSTPGDTAAALRFKPSSSGPSIPEPEIPVTLRTLIPITEHGGNFAGTLTGGNGRPETGPTQTYEFDVPEGTRDLSLTLNLADSGYSLEGLLVDPNGMQLSVEPNIDPNTFNTLPTMQLFRDHPQPGRWHFVLMLNYQSSGNQTSLPFSAHIGLNTAQFSAPGLPNNSATRLSASAPAVTIPITVTNTGSVTGDFFADARLYHHVFTPIPVGQCAATSSMPGACLYTFIPTQADYVQFVAQSTVPITMDAYNTVYNGAFDTGSPDLYAFSTGPDTVTASLSTHEVPWTYWIIVPSEIGPYGPGGAPFEPVQTAVYAAMRPFDPSMTADSGDVYPDLTFGTNTYNPLVLAPGASGIINLTITPDPSQIGQTVKGFVYIDTFSPVTYSGDEVIRIPYEYTIAP